MKRLLSGNEAIALGAWEAGVRYAAAYPGTPSTEILPALAQYAGVRAEWSSNEKVALDAAVGASFAGARALAAMKHVGVNVASDSLMTLSYTGVGAGLALVSADDPGTFSSQNEQDNRHYARFGKFPCLEPADSQEAKDLTRFAFELSERFDTPVMVRTTTRLSHSKSAVEVEMPTEARELAPLPPFERHPRKYVMIPAHARPRHPEVEARMQAMAEYAETCPLNRVEWDDRRIGVISNGVAYQYAREVFAGFSFLKPGVTWPLAATRSAPMPGCGSTTRRCCRPSSRSRDHAWSSSSTRRRPRPTTSSSIVPTVRPPWARAPWARHQRRGSSTRISPRCPSRCRWSEEQQLTLRI